MISKFKKFISKFLAFKIIYFHFQKRKKLKSFSSSNLGNNTYIDRTVQIFGWEAVFVGNNSALSEDVWINANKVRSDETRVMIGNNCHIGRRNYFSTATKISILDYSFTGIDCHFLSCGHITKSPYTPYLTSGITDGKPIFVGVNCWLTTSVTVLGGVSIGHGSVIGAGSLVNKDIPPFSLAVGNPCKVIKRFNFKDNKWESIENWSEELNQLIPTENEYLKILKLKSAEINPALHASSKLFGWI